VIRSYVIIQLVIFIIFNFAAREGEEDKNMSTQQETSPQPRLRLTAARNKNKLSQREVADKLGTTLVNVSRWERGITRPSPYFRRRLIELFGKTEQELDLLPMPDSEEEAPPQEEIAVTPQVVHDPAIPLLPSTPLIGRDQDLEDIRRRLLPGGSVALTALNGLPGVGKTALTIRLAHDETIRAHFSDGILWAGLGPKPNVPGLLNHWGQLLGVSATQVAEPKRSEDWARALRTAIGSRKMLLIIDDAWDVTQALIFKVGGSNCAHLVTTRFPIIASQISIDNAIVLHELDDEQGLRLLRHLAPQVVSLAQQQTQELVHSVGGLPLALTLMGNYLRKQAYTNQPRRINAALTRLNDARMRMDIDEPNVPVESHPSLPHESKLSLDSIISVTIKFLSDPQSSAALFALSVFPPKPNSFSEEAALVVAGCTTDALDQLNDAGLLESSSSGRYTLHQTIADYARLRLSDSDARVAHERLVAYAVDFTAVNKKEYDLLDQELTILTAALDAALELEMRREFIEIICALVPYLQTRAHYALEERYLRQAHEAAKRLDDSCWIINTLLYLGNAVHMQGDFEQAETLLQEGLERSRKTGDKDQISALLADLGWVTWKRGNFSQAETYLQEGLPLARQIDQPERICKILRVIGSIENNRGRYSKAEVYLQEGLRLALQVNDYEAQFRFFTNLGVGAVERGRFTQAITYYLEGLKVARQLGHLEGMIILLGNLGDAESELENYMQAEAYFQEGLMLARQIGHREWMAAVLYNLGRMTRKRCNYRDAKLYLQESLALAQQVGRLEITCCTLYDYGCIYLAEMQIETAKATFEDLLTTAPEDFQDFIALAQYGLARVAALQGDIREARRLGEVSLTTLDAIQYRDAGEVRVWLDSIVGQAELQERSGKGESDHGQA
jgi:tetratricopeptide (TPR) repeat protein/transcriptional regulator with XRE-family HTH domain